MAKNAENELVTPIKSSSVQSKVKLVLLECICSCIERRMDLIIRLVRSSLKRSSRIFFLKERIPISDLGLMECLKLKWRFTTEAGLGFRHKTHYGGIPKLTISFPLSSQLRLEYPKFTSNVSKRAKKKPTSPIASLEDRLRRRGSRSPDLGIEKLF